MTVYLSQGNMKGTNLLLSIESADGQKNDFSYHPTFKPNSEFSLFPIKMHSKAISLSYKVDEIKFVRFYSNSASTDTFFVFKVLFYPTYLGDQAKFDYFNKMFYPAISSRHYREEMSHNTWYILDNGIN